jgi:hypothetical protein
MNGWRRRRIWGNRAQYRYDSGCCCWQKFPIHRRRRCCCLTHDRGCKFIPDSRYQLLLLPDSSCMEDSNCLWLYLPLAKNQIVKKNTPASWLVYCYFGRRKGRKTSSKHKINGRAVVDRRPKPYIQPSKSYYISRGRVIHISLTKRVVKVLHKPISRPFCNRYKELSIFKSKRVVKVLHKSISLPAAKRVVKVLHKSISLPFSKKYQISVF